MQNHKKTKTPYYVEKVDEESKQPQVDIADT